MSDPTVSLNYLDAVVLGVVEGLTEFLPVSSTGHLTITEKLLGMPIDNPSITSFTAIIQLGAILATLIYFFKDILRFLRAWVNGLANADKRHDHDYRLAWAVIAGSIPIGIVGFLTRDFIKGPLRNMWVVAVALLVWSVVMWWAERSAAQRSKDSGVVDADTDTLSPTAPAAGGGLRGEGSVSVKDGLIIGTVQCLALVPGVSRSGATISAGLLRGIDRVTATRLSFFLAIPALVAAGVFEMRDVDFGVVGLGPMLVGTAISFVVAYASIAWLLKFVANNSLMGFVWYRVALGAALILALSMGWLAAT